MSPKFDITHKYIYCNVCRTSFWGEDLAPPHPLRGENPERIVELYKYLTKVKI